MWEKSSSARHRGAQKKKPKVARKGGPRGGGAGRGGASQAPSLRAGLKDWCRGGRAAERAAAVAAARLPAPEHAREPPRRPPPPRPRRPAPRRQVRRTLGDEARGRGEERTGPPGAGAASGAAWWGRGRQRPWPLRAPAWRTPRLGYPQRRFLLLFCPNRPDEAPVPALAGRRQPRGGEPRTRWPESGTGFCSALLSTPPSRLGLGGGTARRRAPTRQQAHFLDESTEAQRAARTQA